MVCTGGLYWRGGLEGGLSVQESGSLLSVWTRGGCMEEGVSTEGVGRMVGLNKMGACNEGGTGRRVCTGESVLGVNWGCWGRSVLGYGFGELY